MHIYVCLGIFYCSISSKNRFVSPSKCPPVLSGSPQKGASHVSANLSLVVAPYDNFCVPFLPWFFCIHCSQKLGEFHRSQTPKSMAWALSPKFLIFGWQSFLGMLSVRQRWGKSDLLTVCQPPWGPKTALLRSWVLRHLCWMVPSASVANASCRDLKFSTGVKRKERCSSFSNCSLPIFFFFCPCPSSQRKFLLSCPLSSKSLY